MEAGDTVCFLVYLIVLDDYHLIKKVEVHSMMQLLLKRQTDALHLVILTREHPPFSLSRMRVQGQITEIGERYLRFTRSEAQTFLVPTMGLELSAPEIDKLKERTEGCATGLYLTRTGAAAGRSWSSSNRETCSWYHHLFSEMLFHSLQRSFLEQVPALHRKASEWFEAQGRMAKLSIEKALICTGQGNLAVALEELEGALEIPRTHGYSRFFNDGPVLDRLLHQAMDRNILAP